MNATPDEAGPHHQPNESASERSNDAQRPPHEPGATAAREFARRAEAFARGLPGRLDEQLKAKPYTVLALACIASAAVGVVLSSRVLRSVLTTTLTAAALEVARGVVRGNPARARAT